MLGTSVCLQKAGPGVDYDHNPLGRVKKTCSFCCRRMIFAVYVQRKKFYVLGGTTCKQLVAFQGSEEVVFVHRLLKIAKSTSG